jgi:hypothetical protein
MSTLVHHAGPWPVSIMLVPESKACHGPDKSAGRAEGSTQARHSGLLFGPCQPIWPTVLHAHLTRRAMNYFIFYRKI